MGIIILPLFIIAVVVVLKRGGHLVDYLRESHDFKVLVFGALLVCLELFLAVYKWYKAGEVAAVTPTITTLWWMVLVPGLLVLILNIFSNPFVRELALVIEAKIVILFVTVMVYAFAVAPFFDLFEKLNIRTYY